MRTNDRSEGYLPNAHPVLLAIPWNVVNASNLDALLVMPQKFFPCYNNTFNRGSRGH